MPSIRKKCTIDWSTQFYKGVLTQRNSGFTPKWMRILYTDMRAKININGKITEYIKFECSVRQGCPVSMLLFVLAAEIWRQVIRLTE